MTDERTGRRYVLNGRSIFVCDACLGDSNVSTTVFNEGEHLLLNPVVFAQRTLLVLLQLHASFCTPVCSCFTNA